jgi:membrane-bound lytic murein transglycosylase D
VQLRILIAGTAVAIWCAGCTGNRQVATGQAPPQAGPAVVEEVVVDNAAAKVEAEQERARTVAFLMSDAQAVFERGRAQYEASEFEVGRVYFDEALALLRHSGFSFRDFPELEQKYHDLEQDIRRIQILARVGWDEPPLPLDEFASPLDELAALDLYTVEVDPALEHLVSEDLRRTAFDFPVVVNQEVVKLLDYYQGRGRKATEEAIQRSGRYLPMIKAIFREEGLPQDLIYMAHAESLFKPKAFSRARARGIWQFMAGTARLYDLKVNFWLDERLDVAKATRGAARHLKDLKAEFGDWYLALAAYNSGPGRVGRVIKRHGEMDYWKMTERRLLPLETRNYVPSILASIFIYRNPARYGFEVALDPPLEYEEVPVSDQVDLVVMADLIGVEHSVLADLNLELLRGVTPGTGGHSVKVPPGKGAPLMAGLADLPPSQRLRFQNHRVQRGETLSLIARRYGVSVSALAEANSLRNIHRLSLGQELMVPVGGASTALRASAGSRPGAAVRARGGTRSPERHVVRPGDSLYKIARAYGLRLGDLFRWNNLRPGTLIHPGQEIRLTD